jgi:hypothetical protein
MDFKTQKEQPLEQRRTSGGNEALPWPAECVEGGGHRPYWLTRPAALWLEKRLQFPNWTAESIARMGETHIMDWAERNHVAMDKLHAPELREGGTR